MKLNALFPHVICVFTYLAHVDVWIREYGFCVTEYLYSSETGLMERGILFECVCVLSGRQIRNQSQLEVDLNAVY